MTKIGKFRFIMAKKIIKIRIRNWQYFWEKFRLNIRKNLGSKCRKIRVPRLKELGTKSGKSGSRFIKCCR